MPFSEPSQKKIDTLWLLHITLVVICSPSPQGVCLCVFIHFWAEGAATFTTSGPGPVKPTSKVLLRGKDTLRQMLDTEQLLQQHR